MTPTRYEFAPFNESRAKILRVAESHGITLVVSPELADGTRPLEKGYWNSRLLFHRRPSGEQWLLAKGIPLADLYPGGSAGRASDRAGLMRTSIPFTR